MRETSIAFFSNTCSHVYALFAATHSEFHIIIEIANLTKQSLQNKFVVVRANCTISKMPPISFYVWYKSLYLLFEFPSFPLLVQQYPVVARVYRDSAKNKPVYSQCCFGSVASGMIDYKDLEKLLQNPQNLQFTFELIDVQHSGQYEKEYWQITDDDKRGLIPQLKEEGNKYYFVKDYKKAIEKYNLALNFIDHLQLREKPRDDEWNALNTMKLTFYLNLAQCKLCLKEYYAAIDYANQVLQQDSKNIKALFRRGKAHLQVWNLTEAEDDLNQVLQLNSSLKSSVLPLLFSLKKAKLESKQTEKLFATRGVS